MVFSEGWGPRNLNDPICLGWVKVRRWGDSDEIFDDPSHLPHRKENQQPRGSLPPEIMGKTKAMKTFMFFFPKSHVFKAVNQCCSDKVFPKWWLMKIKVFRKKVIYQEQVFSIIPNEEYQTILSLQPKKWGGSSLHKSNFFVASPSPSCHRLTLTRSYEYVLSLSPSNQLPNRQGAAVCQECLQVCEFFLNAFSFLMIKVT